MVNIQKRAFIKAGVASLPLTLNAAYGETVCEPKPYGSWCDSMIHSSKFSRVRALQQTMVWCWAATLEMIFRWHGRDISQRTIVEQTFGSPLNVPASPIVLAQSINRSYSDQNGKTFNVRSKIWSPDFGVQQINNHDIIKELHNERPMVVCNLTHMMVLVGVNYNRFGSGAVSVNQAWVVDPMLVGDVTSSMGNAKLPPGFRYLMPAEITPVWSSGQLRFLATVTVS